MLPHDYIYRHASHDRQPMHDTICTHRIYDHELFGPITTALDTVAVAWFLARHGEDGAALFWLDTSACPCPKCGRTLRTVDDGRPGQRCDGCGFECWEIRSVPPTENAR